MTDTATASLMSGTELARRLVAETTARAAAFTQQHGTQQHGTQQTGQQPCLATVLVGDDPASTTYVRMKQNRSRRAGISSRHVALPSTTTTAELVHTIEGLSQDPSVHGILLQHPVPAHIDERAA